MNAEISKCPIITVAYPEKFIPRSHIYYGFKIKGKNYHDSFIMPYPTMGKFERGKNLMKERFWVQISCNDYTISRIYWEAKVPDTLQFVPPNGWDKIPYGLDNK